MRTNALAATLLGFTTTAVIGVALADDTGAISTAATAPAGASPPPPPVRRAATRAPHWAYQPVQHYEAPAVEHRAWVRTPIDAFVLAKLEAAKLAPSPDADRATFIRRATLDVWGVIPTPEEVAAFVADRSPDAYEKLVDRLLASPQYGERQARRWLDLARYADSTGFEGDQTRAAMWRYRDYVIDAFNADKPFDQFVKEQLAGDEIVAPDDPRGADRDRLPGAIPTTTTRAIWSSASTRSPTDMTDTVGEVFLGQTVQCARCHNHKFDPISQKEYFQLQAFFANVAEVTDIPVQERRRRRGGVSREPGEVRRSHEGSPRPAAGAARARPRRDDQVPEGTVSDR